MADPKPLREGYSGGYRRKLEREFLGPVGKERMGRAPAWVRELVSRLLKEVENRHADCAALKARLEDVRSCLREPEDDFDRDYDFIITRHIAGRIAETIGQPHTEGGNG